VRWFCSNDDERRVHGNKLLTVHRYNKRACSLFECVFWREIGAHSYMASRACRVSP
jgi:hypothetical protein